MECLAPCSRISYGFAASANVKSMRTNMVKSEVHFKNAIILDTQLDPDRYVSRFAEQHRSPRTQMANRDRKGPGSWGLERRRDLALNFLVS